MWKYLIVNSLWFSILFLVHFFGSKKDQLIILVSVFVAAAVLAFQGFMDPGAWFLYVLFSCLVYAGAANFKRWSYVELTHLRGEIAARTREYDAEKNALDVKTQQTGFLERKADEIVEFYEQIKEMSKSLDSLETFLIFAEALSEYFEFEVVKLSLFSEKHPESAHPEEVYKLLGTDLRGVFDRSAYLKDKGRARGEVFPFDRKVYRHLFEHRRPFLLTESKEAFYADSDAPGKPFTAYPVFIHEKIFAVLTLIGIEVKGDPLFYILIDRFLSEMQRVKLYERVEMLAITDGLTGVYVRRHLVERLEGELDRSRRFGYKLSFLMVDIDLFKHVNDEYGHLVGDTVLRQVAEAVKKSVREVDFVGRYGGEEFAVGLIETDESTAAIVAERIRKSVESREFKAYGENIQVTVSVGCATYSPTLSSVNQMIEAADAALYQAKRLGRNRIICSTNGGGE